MATLRNGPSPSDGPVVGVVTGGVSGERERSLLSGATVSESLRRQDHTACLIAEIDRTAAVFYRTWRAGAGRLSDGVALRVRYRGCPARRSMPGDGPYIHGRCSWGSPGPAITRAARASSHRSSSRGSRSRSRGVSMSKPKTGHRSATESKTAISPQPGLTGTSVNAGKSASRLAGSRSLAWTPLSVMRGGLAAAELRRVVPVIVTISVIPCF